MVKRIVNLYKKYRRGCLRVLIFRNGKYKIVPIDNEINLTPISSNSLVYGTSVMETFTVYKNQNDKIGIALLDQRLLRLFSKTIILNKIHIKGLIKSELRKQIINYVKHESHHLFKLSKTKKATLRLNLIQGIGKYGIGSETEDIVLSVEMVGVKNKKKSPDCSVLVGEFQRNEPFFGKQSYHYAEGVRLKTLMHKYQTESILYFSNFLSTDESKVYIFDRLVSLSQKQSVIKNLAISNTIGAEIFAINSSNELVYPPIRVNRLGGVTLEFVKNVLAPKLGIKTLEQTFSIQDILDGKIVELVMCGNNAEITPINQLRFERSMQMNEITLNCTEVSTRLKDSFNAEIQLGAQGKLLSIIVLPN